MKLCRFLIRLRASHFSVRSQRNLSGPPQFATFQTNPDDIGTKCQAFKALCQEFPGTGSIDLTLSAPIAEIKLNNPTKRNAMSGKMMLELDEAITKLENWPEGKAVILYGQGEAFCSGGDLDFVRKICTPELGVEMSTFMQHTLNRLTNLPMIVTAFVRGPAHGGGAELVTAADYRVFGRTADVRFVQAKLGITTGWGGATRLTEILGPRLALRVLLSCEILHAKNSSTMRFCDLVVKDLEGLEMTKIWVADNFLRASPEIIAAYKSVITEQNVALSGSYAREVGVFRRFWGSPVHIAAIENVLTKP